MDILSVAAIKLACAVCGGHYCVPLRDVLLSHELLHEGCPVAQETECPPAFQRRLFTKESIEALEQAWECLEKGASKDGGELVLMRQPQL